LLWGFDPLRIGGKIQKGQILLFVDVGVDHVRLVTAKLRPVKQEPEEKQVSDNRDPYAFTAESARALVFEPVNQVKEFIRFQLLVAHALPFGEWLR
jgi:hypothetical protein